MKTIKKDELFENFTEFLNAKGVELKDGDYARRINRACDLLTDTINGTQSAVKRARVEVDKKLTQLRQTIHEATAPRSAASSGKSSTGAKAKKGAATKAKASSKKSKSRK
jgi:hypothetical protein